MQWHSESVGELRVMAGYVPTRAGEIFVHRMLPPRPVGEVVIVPPFGKSVHDLFVPAHYLCANGFVVTRFDPSNHVGRGSGDIRSFTLSGVERDLETVMDLDRERWPQVLVGMSLAAPIAWRAAKRSRRPVGVVSLVGVVDVPDTVERVCGDSVAPYRAGAHAPEYQRFFGYDVKAAPFVKDMDASGYGSFRDIAETVAALPGEVHFVVAKADEYVDFAKARAVVEGRTGRSKLTVLDGVGHEIGKSTGVFLRAVGVVTELCVACVNPSASTEVRRSRFTDVVRASGDESAFLGRFDAIHRTIEFQEQSA